MALTIQLPSHRAQVKFNLRRWAELLADRELAKIEGRIETDRHGHIIMSPPPGAFHGGCQFEVGHLLGTLMPGGRVITVCPISTADGVRAADVVWISRARLRGQPLHVCLTRAPEICVEVLSPSNTKREIAEKFALYFEAGAEEAWVCRKDGGMEFHLAGESAPVAASLLCPAFPQRVKLAS